jgi:hypothetical protein
VNIGGKKKKNGKVYLFFIWRFRNTFFFIGCIRCRY